MVLFFRLFIFVFFNFVNNTNFLYKRFDFALQIISDINDNEKTIIQQSTHQQNNSPIVLKKQN